MLQYYSFVWYSVDVFWILYPMSQSSSLYSCLCHHVTFAFYQILSPAPCPQTPSFSTESVAFMATVCCDVVWTEELCDCGIHIRRFIPASPYLMIIDPNTLSETSNMNSTFTWLVVQGTSLHCRSVHRTLISRKKCDCFVSSHPVVFAII
jgi:hypothetical protein